jgi:hypothetical protein
MGRKKEKSNRKLKNIGKNIKTNIKIQNRYKSNE